MEIFLMLLHPATLSPKGYRDRFAGRTPGIYSKVSRNTGALARRVGHTDSIPPALCEVTIHPDSHGVYHGVLQRQIQLF